MAAIVMLVDRNPVHQTKDKDINTKDPQLNNLDLQGNSWNLSGTQREVKGPILVGVSSCMQSYLKGFG